jgi:hypothetical protein
MERVRFSEVLRDLNKDVAALPDAAKKKVIAALEKSCKKTGTRKLNDGRTVDLVDFDAASFAESFPAELKAEGKAFVRAAADEVKYRGQAWGDECLHVAVKEYVTGNK